MHGKFGPSMGPFTLALRVGPLVEGKDLNPVRALAGGIDSEPAGLFFSVGVLPR